MPSTMCMSQMVDLALGTPELGAVNFNVLHALLHAMLQKLDLTKAQASISDADRALLTGLPQIDDQMSVTADSGVAESVRSDTTLEARTSSPAFHILNRKVSKLEQQLQMLNELPSNDQLIRKGSSEQSRPVSEMWQVMQLTHRVDNNESGINKLMTLVDDLLKAQNELKAQTQKQLDQMRSLVEELAKEQKGFKEQMQKQFDDMKKSVDDLRKEQAALRESTEALKKGQDSTKLMALLDDLKKHHKDLEERSKKQYDDLMKLFDDLKKEQEALRESNEALKRDLDNKQLDELRAEIKEINDRLDKLNAILDDNQPEPEPEPSPRPDDNLPQPAPILVDDRLRESQKDLERVMKTITGDMKLMRAQMKLLTHDCKEQFSTLNDRLSEWEKELQGVIAATQRIKSLLKITRPLSSEPPIPVVTPLSSEPPMPVVTPLSSEPSIPVVTPLSSEPSIPVVNDAATSTKSQSPSPTPSPDEVDMSRIINLEEEIVTKGDDIRTLQTQFEFGSADTNRQLSLLNDRLAAMERAIKDAMASMGKSVPEVAAAPEFDMTRIINLEDEMVAKGDDIKGLHTQVDFHKEDTSRALSALKEHLARLQKEIRDAIITLEQLMNDGIASMEKKMADQESNMANNMSQLEDEWNRFKDEVEKQLKAINRKINKMEMIEGGPFDDTAAGLRKQMMQRFNCISCDRPIEMMPQSAMPSISMPNALPATRSARPYTTFELEQIRQHAKRINNTNLTNYENAVCERQMAQSRMQQRKGRTGAAYLKNLPSGMTYPLPPIKCVNQSETSDLFLTNRACGGGHTLTYPHRRITRASHITNVFRDEPEQPLYKEELEIQGADGHIYRGRNADEIAAANALLKVNRQGTAVITAPTPSSESPIVGRKSPAQVGLRSYTPSRVPQRPGSARSTPRPGSAGGQRPTTQQLPGSGQQGEAPPPPRPFVPPTEVPTGRESTVDTPQPPAPVPTNNS